MLIGTVAMAQAGKRSNNKKTQAESGTTNDTESEPAAKPEAKPESGTNTNTNTNTNSNTNDGVTETVTESNNSGHWVAAEHNLKAAKRHLTQAGADAAVIANIDAALRQVEATSAMIKANRKKEGGKGKGKHKHHGHGHGHDHKH